jgi:hypothetical protein
MVIPFLIDFSHSIISNNFNKRFFVFSILSFLTIVIFIYFQIPYLWHIFFYLFTFHMLRELAINHTNQNSLSKIILTIPFFISHIDTKRGFYQHYEKWLFQFYPNEEIVKYSFILWGICLITHLLLYKDIKILFLSILLFITFNQDILFLNSYLMIILINFFDNKNKLKIFTKDKKRTILIILLSSIIYVLIGIIRPALYMEESFSILRTIASAIIFTIPMTHYLISENYHVDR